MINLLDLKVKMTPDANCVLFWFSGPVIFFGIFIYFLIFFWRFFLLDS